MKMVDMYQACVVTYERKRSTKRLKTKHMVPVMVGKHCDKLE